MFNQLMVILMFYMIGVMSAMQTRTYEFTITTDHEFFRYMEETANCYPSNCTQTEAERCYEMYIEVDGGPECKASEYLKELNLTIPEEVDTAERDSDVAVIASSLVVGATVAGTAGYYGYRVLTTLRQSGSIVLNT